MIRGPTPDVLWRCSYVPCLALQLVLCHALLALLVLNEYTACPFECVEDGDLSKLLLETPSREAKAVSKQYCQPLCDAQGSKEESRTEL
jgi:hypothetical protein